MSRETGPTRKVRAVVIDRDNGLCVLCGASGTDIHHRRPRGMGGSSLEWVNQPANLIVVCRHHHLLIESSRAWAYENGFLIRQGDDIAAMIPLTYPDRLVWLHDDGTTNTFPRVRTV